MFCVFLVTSAQLAQEPLTRENVSLLKKIFPSNLEVINARVYPGLLQNGGDDSSTCLTSVMKVRNEFRPVKYRAGCGAQAFPIAGPLGYSFPVAFSVIMLDFLPARAEACLFLVHHKHAVDACCFVNQTSNLCRAGPALLVCGGRCHWQDQRQPHPSPALGRGPPHCGLGRCSVLPSPLDFPHRGLPASDCSPARSRHNLLKHASSLGPPPAFPTTPWGCSVECRHRLCLSRLFPMR